MKRLLLLSITLFVKLNSLAQINPNSETEFYVLRIGPADYFATGLWSYVDGFKEKVNFDSIRFDTLFYTINRTNLLFKKEANKYHLLNIDSAWYYRGKIKSWNDSIISHQIVYNYRLNKDDTLKHVRFDLNEKPYFDCYAVIKNVDSVQINNSEHVIRQRYKPSNCEEFSYGFYNIEDCGRTFETNYNLGSSAGLIPFNIDKIQEYWGGSPSTLLLSACEKGELLHALPCVKEKFSTYNLCDSAQVAEVIKEISLSLSSTELVAQAISVYPNPAINTLKIDGAEAFTFQIMELSGKTVLSGYSQKQIDISNLPSGVYHLSLVLNETVLNTQFVKN